MAPLKLSSIISCSSEDRVACAQNLLTVDSFKKWTTEKPGILKATVVIQLAEAHFITGLDIGNNGSAFVEVLVGNTGSEDYENLIITSSFMTPSESRSQTNRFKMRLFAKADLCQGVLNRKWDRLKVVCTQPYNKLVTYGLSVFTVNGPQSPSVLKVEESPLSGKRPVPKKSENPAVNMKKKEEPVSSGSPERKIASDLLSMLESSASKEALERLKASGDKLSTQSPARLTNSSVIDIDFKDEHRPSSIKSSSKLQVSTKSSPSTPVRSTSSRMTQPTSNSSSDEVFSEILKGVVFVLSGFQNPLRSDIREIGLSMGACYRPDWCPDATHLICSVANTPKFNQVKGKGIIVGKDWLFDCKRLKKRVPIKRFRLDRPTQHSSENDDASDEEEKVVSSKRRQSTKNIVYCDSSEEEEEVHSSRKRKKEDDPEFVQPLIISSDEEREDASEQSSPRKVSLPNISDSEEEEKPAPDPYEEETDDETEDDVIARLNLPRLPNIFSGHSFFLHSDALSADQLHSLHRFLVAYGGQVDEHMSRDVMFIVTGEETWKSDFDQALSVNPAVKFLRKEWVVDCSNDLIALPKAKYYVCK